MKIDGRKIAKEIFEELKVKVKKLRTKNIIPHLAIILIGHDPASTSYIEQKDLRAEEIGAKTTIINLESKIQNSELKKLIEKLNDDESVHGIIVQQPLPSHINIKQTTEAISPKKDVDGFNSKSKFQPPIALAVLKIIKPFLSKSKRIVSLGKGETGGQPVAEVLKKMNIKPIIIDSKTKNPKAITKNADIIISAVGKPSVIKPDMIKRGVILVSIGLHKGPDGKLHGDYDEDEIKNIASFYTPTPGGVGPVNVAMLLENLVYAAS